MGSWLLSLASPEALSWVGFAMLAIALAGEVGVFLIPAKWDLLHKELAFGFAVLASAGYMIERVGDDAIIAKLEARAERAVSDLAKLRTPRSLALTTSLDRFGGQMFSGAISSGAPDGRILWNSIHAALKHANWVFVPPHTGYGDPPAAVPIAPQYGVVVYVSPNIPPFVRRPSEAADALIAALKAAGIKAERVNAEFGDMTRNPILIEIVIGTREQ